MHCYFRKFSTVLSSNLLNMRNVRKRNPAEQGTSITLQAVYKTTVLTEAVFHQKSTSSEEP